MGAMPRDPFVREKFTRERTAAKKLAAEYFEHFPKDRYQTEVESWRHLQSQNIEFTMKRLREPIEWPRLIRGRGNLGPPLFLSGGCWPGTTRPPSA